MKRISISLYLLTTLFLSSCSTDIDFNDIIDNSKPFEIEKNLLNTSNYSSYKKIINQKSKKWLEFNKWLVENKNDWYQTPASYITEITIKQDDFNLLFFTDKDGESIVINFIDKKGNGKQYGKSIKKGELDFIIGDLKQIRRISKYGALFSKEKQNKHIIKHLKIEDFETYYDFKMNIENTLCNDSIPQIEMWNKNDLKIFTPFDCCPSKYFCIMIKHRDIIEIRDNHFFENSTVYDLDSLYPLMKRKYLKKVLKKHDPKPEDVYFQIIYQNDENMQKLKELLNRITMNYDSLGIKNSLKIRFGGYEIVDLTDDVEQKTPHNNVYTP